MPQSRSIVARVKIAAALLFALFFALSNVAIADEGMWTFDHFPSKAVGAKYGFAPSQTWLDHVRSSTLRIAGGCSASFISPQGLVMTNHHCVVECEGSLSTAQSDLVANGFYAKSDADEQKCPGFEIDQLTSISNVTKQMQAATKGLDGPALTAAIRAENITLQKACSTDHAIRCDVVSLYHGGVYDVYKYNRFRDIRLVFAPEFAIAQNGGDVDNFNFPRFDFDFALIRVYGADGKPAASPQYLHWSANGAKAGAPVFVPGNPGSTQRGLTVSQLEYLRDTALPANLASLAELRGLLEEYGTLGAEQLRTSSDTLFYLENNYKVTLGQSQALDDPAFFATLVAQENALRAKVKANPSLQRQYGDAWNKLAAIQQLRVALATAQTLKGGNLLNRSTSLFGIAQTLVRLPVEKAKPDAQRLPDYTNTALVTLPDELFDPTPIYPAADQVVLGFALDSLRREYGPDDPFVKAALDGRSPYDEAAYLIANTKLQDVAVRKALYDGGEPAVQASNDAFIQFALRIDALSRAASKSYEDQVLNPSRPYTEAIAKARFAIDGTSVYPDATFSPRLSYGTVVGFTDSHGVIPPFTTIGGLFAHASLAAPFILPQSWLAARASLDPSTPMNLSTSNDITGGNSGSPLIDTKGDVVGLMFDGNIHSLGGSFGYDPKLNRAVAVDSRAIIAGLTHVYHADRIVTEITGAK